MRKSHHAICAAAAAVSVFSLKALGATSYTWADLGGGTQSWTDTIQWSPNGYPIGASAAGDSANLNVALSSNLSVNVPSGSYYVDNLKLGSNSAAVTTDVGNGGAGGGTLIFDGGTPNLGVYSDISSLGIAGNTNIISAPIVFDENDASTQGNWNGKSSSVGNYYFSTPGVISSTPPIAPIPDGLPASVIIDPNSTNNLTLNGAISQTASITAAICNLMSSNQTLTINGNITITPATSTVAQAFVLTGTTGSMTVVNGIISDGSVGDSTMAYGNSSPSKTTVFPAISPTIEINGANTYTGVTTMNMSTLILGNNQALGIESSTATVGSQGELRMGGTANEFGYNLEAANDSITINNGIDVTEYLTIEGAHSLTINGYMYQSVQREIVNLLPAGKSLTINGQIYCQQTTQNRTWDFDGSGLTVVNGSIHNSFADDTASNQPIIKNGTGVVLLDGAVGTYSGSTTVNGGLLEFAAPGSYGDSNGSTGTSSVTVALGGAVALDSNVGGTAGTTDSTFLGLISSSSTGALALSSLDSGANLNFTTGTLANLANMSVGADNAGVTYTGTITPGNSTYRLGGGGTLTIPNAGNNALTGTGNSLVVSNGGTVIVNGTNTYGGTTTIQGAYVLSDQTRAATNDYSQPEGAFEPVTLAVSSLANGGTASGIGSSSNAASNLVISGATLQYIGSGSTTDRLFTMTSAGATLDASGTGVVDFTNSGAIAQLNQAAITNVTVSASTTGVPFNQITLPTGTSTGMISIGMTVSDTQGAITAASTVVGVSNNAIYLNTNLLATVIGDTLTFGNQNRTLTLTGTNTGQNILSAAVSDSTSGKVSVNKTGSGTWVLAGNNTYTGGTTVNSGELIAGSSTALPANGKVSILGGTLQLGASTGAATFAATSLTISGNGTLDVNNNHVFINYGSGPDPIASIAALLAHGYNGGAWNGTGIDTSAPLVNGGLTYGLGYADGADPQHIATGLASGTIEIKYTLLGDADLNGIVNGIDFGILAANFNKGITGWDEGDFDYNNIVNGLDFGDLAANFNKGAAGTDAVAALDAFAAANGLLADVPEPASASCLTLGLVGLLAKRRRSRRQD